MSLSLVPVLAAAAAAAAVVVVVTTLNMQIRTVRGRFLSASVFGVAPKEGVLVAAATGARTVPALTVLTAPVVASPVRTLIAPIGVRPPKMEVKNRICRPSLNSKVEEEEEEGGKGEAEEVCNCPFARVVSVSVSVSRFHLLKRRVDS